MPRRVQDIVPGDKRSIRNLPIERRARTARAEEADGETDVERDEAERPAPAKRSSERSREIPIRRIPITPPPVKRPRRPARSHAGMWTVLVLGIVVVVAGAGFAASTYFSRATFTIIPKAVPVTANATYVAQAAPASTPLTYELVTVHGSVSATVPATEGQKVSASAKGTITVYNAYSTETQRLVAGTRFASTDGKVYRTTSSLVIPGYTKSGGAIKPGAVTATVVASEPGESYNIPLTASAESFTIVAYKGTPRYSTMYGKQASSISGGFVGTKKIVPSSVTASTTDRLKSELTAKLLAEAQESVPEGYILYNNAFVPDFSEPTIGGTDPAAAEFSLQGSLTGIILNRDQLARRLAGEQSAGSFGSYGFIPTGLNNLAVSIANTKDFSPAKKNTLLLRIEGDIELVGAIPTDEIKRSVAGASLGDTERLLKPYDDVIASGSGELVPPWAKIPTDLNRISVVVDEPSRE